MKFQKSGGFVEMKNKFCLLFALAFAVLIMNFVSASSTSFTLGNISENIKTSYSPEEKLEGWINISFSNQPSDSLLQSNFLGKTNLIEFLKNNSIEYGCKPADCKDDYTIQQAEESKSFSLNALEEKIFAFVVKGSLNKITNLEFEVSGSNNPSCLPPLEIDILDDETIDYTPKNISNEFLCAYEKGFGCFDAEEEFQEVYIGKTPYCEKISLTKSNKFELGVYVKKDLFSDYSEDTLNMVLYNLNGEELKSCTLIEPSIIGGTISCQIEYSNKEIKEHYVCIKSESKDVTKYLIRKEDKQPCGFYAFPGQEKEEHDYYIFAKGARYENIGKVKLNQSEYEQEGNSGSLTDYINTYIEERYEKNCLDNCKIPVKFKANTDVNIELSNLKISYSTLGGIQTPETKIYNAEKKPSLITANFSALDLKFSNIVAPKIPGNYSLELYLDKEKILIKDIFVENAPIITSLYPRIVSAATPTKFILNISIPAGRNISSVIWNFGDNKTETTKENHIIHAYSALKSYTLKAEVVDNLGFKSSKEFSVNVVSAKNAANLTLVNYKKYLDNITFELASMPDWQKNLIEKRIGLENAKNNLKAIETKFNSAAQDEDYTKIMSELTNISAPYKISKSNFVEMPYFVNEEEINLAYLKELGAGDYKENYKKEIALWTGKNVDIKIGFQYITIHYNEHLESLGMFNLNVQGYEKELYLVIKETEILFGMDYKTKEFDDATGIVLLGNELKFSIPDVSPKNLKIYLSPAFNMLEFEKIEPCNFNEECEKELGETWKNCRQDCKPWGIVAILLIIVLAFAFVVYIFLQWWYKVRYESYLFKNRNDIYNIMQFITNARNQKLNDNEIKAKLKKAGWSGEQLSYVFKKIEGKAIMPFDFFKLFKRQDKIK